MSSRVVSNAESVSLITTVYNEARTITDLLESFARQSRLADEILIVDGGSTDGTSELIRAFFKEHDRLNGKLIVKKGVNIATGRNTAIVSSQYNIIAVTDGGCTLDIDWLKKITEPFKKAAPPEIVAGYYAVKASTYFEKCSGILLVPKVKNLNMERFLPSSRSIAFRKDLWRKVGGYPEHIYNAEDTLFDIKMLHTGAKMEFVPDAYVYWQPRSSIRALAKQFYNYRKSDVEAGIWKRTYLRSLATMCSLIAGFFWPWCYLLFATAFAASMLQLVKRLHRSELALMPGLIPLRILQEASEFSGFVMGILKRITHGR